jgi:hypothetical protein
MNPQLSDRYYTHEEARNKLGMTKARFQYWVRTGRIKKIIPPNSKQGVYLKREINALAREMHAFMIAEETKGLEFMKATTEDIEEEYDLATFMFGNAVHDIPTRYAWLNKNPDTDFIVRDSGRLVGFINMLPVKHDTIMRFMWGELRGWEIPAEDVLPYTPGSKLECIVMGMATSPELSALRRAQVGARLISGLAEFLEGLAQQNVTITKFFATSVTPTGIAILKHAGFKEIGQLGKRIALELDVMTSDAPLVEEYRQTLGLTPKQPDETNP